jgi:hypothetical protein
MVNQDFLELSRKSILKTLLSLPGVACPLNTTNFHDKKGHVFVILSKINLWHCQIQVQIAKSSQLFANADLYSF